MTRSQEITAAEPSLRELIDDALVDLDEMDSAATEAIVGEIFAVVYRALKQDVRFGFLTHDMFDLLTANAHERVYQELDRQFDGLVNLDAVHHYLDRVLGDDGEEI